MFRASDSELQALLIDAEKLSHHYAKKYPDIGYDEFYSIAQVAIAKAIPMFDPQRGTLGRRCLKFTCQFFHKHIKKQRRVCCIYPERDSGCIDEIAVQIDDILSSVHLPPAQRKAIEHFLKFKEPPQDVNGRQNFCRAIKRIRKNVTKSLSLRHIIAGVNNDKEREI